MRVRRWLLCVLIPALLAVGSADTAYALFRCVAMGGAVGSHCCCKANPHTNPSCDELSRASCCDEQHVSIQGTVSQRSASATPAVLPAAATRMLVRDLYAPVTYRESFAPRSTPRASGPPLIILHRVLRL